MTHNPTQNLKAQAEATNGVGVGQAANLVRQDDLQPRALIDKKKQGKKNRQKGADFEKRVRKHFWMILKYAEQAKEGANPEDRVVPEGIVEELKIDTFDGYATYKFTDANTTKRFALRQEKLGLKAKYDARTQKAVVLYPNMVSEDIFKALGERLQAQGMEVKWKKE